jgi:hypothetical protein
MGHDQITAVGHARIQVQVREDLDDAIDVRVVTRGSAGSLEDLHPIPAVGFEEHKVVLTKWRSQEAGRGEVVVTVYFPLLVLSETGGSPDQERQSRK